MTAIHCKKPRLFTPGPPLSLLAAGTSDLPAILRRITHLQQTATHETEHMMNRRRPWELDFKSSLVDETVFCWYHASSGRIRSDGVSVNLTAHMVISVTRDLTGIPWHALPKPRKLFIPYLLMCRHVKKEEEEKKRLLMRDMLLRCFLSSFLVAVSSTYHDNAVDK